jgi:hypothetical protein
MPKFNIQPTIHSEHIRSVRLGGNASNTRATDRDIGKPVKLTADSNYTLCAVGDAIEGIITSVETNVYDGYAVGGIVSKGYVFAIANGAQGTPGTGSLTVGQYVLAAAPTAIQVAKTGAYLQVVSATNQATAATAAFRARVVSLNDTNGAVGTTVVIELF